VPERGTAVPEGDPRVSFLPPSCLVVAGVSLATVSVSRLLILCCKRAGGLSGKVNLSYKLNLAGSLQNTNVNIKVRILILSAVQVCCL